VRFRNRRDTREDLEQAEQSLKEARASRVEQQSKRRHEETLMERIDRLAAGNHLAEKFLEAFVERHT
jgi:hypothetical protein